MDPKRQKLFAVLAILTVVGVSGVYLADRGGIFYNDATVTEAPQPIHLYVKEGYDNITLPYPPLHTQNGSRVIAYNKTLRAVTEINNGSGYLNFTVKVVSGYDDMGTVIIRALLIADCNLPSDLKPTGFKFEGIVSNSSANSIDFFEAYNEGTNATTSHSKYIFEGESSNHHIDGFDVNSSVFSAKTVAEWDIDYGKPYTLRLNAVILGLPEEVKATIDINMEGNESP